MKKVIFGFSKPRKWKPFAALIMWWDKTEISHSYTKFESPRWGEFFIYHNAGERTHFMSGNYFERLNQVVEEYEMPLPDDVEAKIGKICVSREGAPYGLKQVLGKGIVCLGALVKVNIKNPFTGNTDCIEEQALILKEGLGLEAPLDINSVTVRPYRDWIAQLPNVKKVV